LSFYTESLQHHPLFTSSSRITTPAMLDPYMRAAMANLLDEASNMGIECMVWESFRSKARQLELYARRKTRLRDVGVHTYGLAVDIVERDDGAPSWKGNFLWLRDLAKKHGLIWGGDWGRPDLKHDFVDLVHVQRCSLVRQRDLFAGTWYPGSNYDPYKD
jgi:hypothetical protein